MIFECENHNKNMEKGGRNVTVGPVWILAPDSSVVEMKGPWFDYQSGPLFLSSSYFLRPRWDLGNLWLLREIVSCTLHLRHWHTERVEDDSFSRRGPTLGAR